MAMLQTAETIPVRDVRTFYTPAQVQAVLQRERARADRASQAFSLVVVQLQEGGPRMMARVARILSWRARLTDEIGWFDSEQLCAVLPDTSTVGACCFARAICELARQSSIRIECSIYAYPSTPPQDTDHHDGGDGIRTRAGAIPGFEPRPAEARGRRDRQLVMHAAADGVDAELHTQGQRIEPMEQLFHRPLPAWKRALDIAGAIIGLAIGTPIMLVAAAMIKLTSHGPVVFRQPRSGAGAKPFSILKLRTMVIDAEEKKAALRQGSEQDGPAFKMTSDPRVTPIGRWLRATSLDELPQFWNVLTGQMSLVGPRPLPTEESDQCAQWHRQRLDVTPGLTCIWQVRGRSRVTFDEWMRMDLEYVHRRTFGHDLKLLLLTLPAVILRRGAH